MSPPELTRDAPVLDVLQPVLVCGLVFGRIELDVIVHDGRQCDVGKMLHLEEPLQRQTGLDGGVGVALRVANLVRIVLYTLHETCFLQILCNLLAANHAVHSDVEWGLLADGAVGVEDVNGLQVVCLTQHVVVGVVSRSDLQTARTELNVHIAVFYYRNHASHQRNNDLATLEPLVLRVFGIDTHSRIAHDGLRTCGCHNGIVALRIAVDDVAGFFQFFLMVKTLQSVHVVFQVEQVALLLTIDNLLGRKSRQCLGVPVDHAQAPIDKSLVVEVNKHLDDTLGAFLVHGEGRTVPVTAGTQTAQLLQDDASVLVGPGPGMLQELLTCQVVLLDALLGQFLHHLCLGGNRSVVSTRHPACILAFHAGTTYKNVLDGVVQHVAHMQHTGHIGRWDDDGIWFAAIGLTAEKLVVQPILVPFGFDLFGVVFAC